MWLPTYWRGYRWLTSTVRIVNRVAVWSSQLSRLMANSLADGCHKKETGGASAGLFFVVAL